MRINFGAGPAALPNVALLRAREDLVDFEGSGLSVVEQSHRGAAFEKVQAAVISLLRRLLAVPDSHEILLLQGGARGQFAMLPLNLLKPGAFGDYVVTGVWARAAYDEASLVGHARIAADTREADGSYPPSVISAQQTRHRRTAATGASRGRRSSASTPTPPTSTSAATTRSAGRSGPSSPTPARCR